LRIGLFVTAKFPDMDGASIIVGPGARRLKSAAKRIRAARVDGGGFGVVVTKPIEHPGMSDRSVRLELHCRGSAKQHARGGRVRQRPFRSLMREIIRIIT